LNRLGYVTLALVVSVAGIDVARAQEATAAQLALVERYVAAVRAEDGRRLRSLYHPATLACINSDNRDYFDFIFAKEMSHSAELGAGFTLTRVDPLNAAAVAASEMGGLIANPVKPTHEFQIDTPFDSKNHSVTILRTAVEQNGTWYLVLGCPTAKVVALFRERLAEGERQKARARQLVGEMREPLRSEIKTLLAQGHRIDAIMRYQDGATVDLVTASQVVDVLDNQ
jgi:hypothetical protein